MHKSPYEPAPESAAKQRAKQIPQHSTINMYVSTSAKKTQARVAALEAEIDALQKILGIDQDAQAIVKVHIGLLHRYNEAKDATQILIGRLAAARNTTIRQIHEDHDLKDTD